MPTAGVTWVGVMPSHRRRGILRQLMTRQLDDIAERGEPLAALTASEGGIYGRFGYGRRHATRPFGGVGEAGALQRRPAVGRDGLVRFVDAGTARKTLPAIYERYPRRAAGHRLAPRPSRGTTCWPIRRLERGGASAQFFLIHPDGFAVYRRQNAYANGFSNGEAVVAELVAVTPEAHAALWRFLLELDLVDTVGIGRYSPDDPLPWLLDDPRRDPRRGDRDDVWLRVDQRAARPSRRAGTSPRTGWSWS